MKKFEIPEPISIPYFDHGNSLQETIKNSSNRRKMSKMHFVCRKIKNIILYRMAYTCPLNSWRVRFHRWRGVHIGDNVYIGQFTLIDNAYPEYVFIEDNVSIAGEVTILAHSNPYVHFQYVTESKVAPTVLKQGAWIGMKSGIVAGVTIGECAIVSAGTIVDKDVPDKHMAKGNPMKVVADFSALM